MPRNKKIVSYLVITTFLAFGFSISLQSLLAAWTAPTVSPPTDNINRPLTEGSDSQVKLGNLSLYNNLYVGDGVANDVFFVDNANSKVGIGTINPTQKLDVAGYIKGRSGLCIGSDCRTSWPSSGSPRMTWYHIPCDNDHNTALGSHNACFITHCSGYGENTGKHTHLRLYCAVWPAGHTSNGNQWTGKPSWFARAYSWTGYYPCNNIGPLPSRADAVCLDW